MDPLLTPLDVRGAGDHLDGLLPRPQLDREEPRAAVRAIIEDVRARGDQALRELTQRFDGVTLDALAVPDAEVRVALEGLDRELRAALEAAAGEIEAFHRSQVPSEHRYERDGVRIDARRQAVDRAGVYVPGGLAAYPSTVLMTAIPARVAGVPEVVLCVPPGPDGRVPEVVLAAASLAGVEEVVRVGGAQAVAAMAYGTESVRPVDVICGPGNVYVALAKQEVAGVVGVPAAFAGPSEVVVVADETAPVEYAAVDVVVQAEHGPDGLACLVTGSEEAAMAVGAAVERLAAASPRRRDIEATLRTGGNAVLVEGPEQAAAVVNRIAPEHLELMVADPDAVLAGVRHAGAVFVGPLAPASLGDYAAGPSHVLPTHGSARYAGALTVEDFQKVLHVVEVDRRGFERLAPVVEVLAAAEGLDEHARSVALRREAL